MTHDAYVSSLGTLPPLLALVGLGDGSLLQSLEDSGWRGRIVAFEPVEIYRSALHASPHFQALQRDDRIRVVEGPDYRGAVDALLAYAGDELRALAEPIFAHRFPDETRAALGAMAKAVRAVRANAESRQRQGDLYCANTLRNAAALIREGDLADLAGVLNGVPAVVVAAGPSLDTQFDALRAVRDRAAIICVDTALRPLLAAGVQPHFVVAVDPTSTNARHLTDLTRHESTWMIAEASVDPHAMDAFTGRIFACRVGAHDPWPVLLSRGLTVGTVRAWGSVLTSAIDATLHMGATTLALAGCDLAYTDGRPYCRGTSFEEHWRRIADWGTPLPVQWSGALEVWTKTEEDDVRGQRTRTAPHLIAFRDWVIEQAAIRTDVRVVNTTGAGILRGGRIEQMSLSDLSGAWPPLDLNRAIGERWRPRPHLASALAGLPTRTPATQSRILPLITPRPEPTWREADPVTMPLVRMVVPPSRMHPAGDGWFTFSLRTRAARRWMSHRYVGEPRVFEGDRVLDEPVDLVLRLDDIRFRPSESDPRFGREAISIELPEDIANYEQLPLDLVLERGL